MKNYFRVTSGEKKILPTWQQDRLHNQMGANLQKAIEFVQSPHMKRIYMIR